MAVAVITTLTTTALHTAQHGECSELTENDVNCLLLQQSLSTYHTYKVTSSSLGNL